jgi:hypothetical protein
LPFDFAQGREPVERLLVTEIAEQPVHGVLIT